MPTVCEREAVLLLGCPPLAFFSTSPFQFTAVLVNEALCFSSLASINSI